MKARLEIEGELYEILSVIKPGIIPSKEVKTEKRERKARKRETRRREYPKGVQRDRVLPNRAILGRKHWTNAERDKMIEERKKRMSWSEIGKLHGRTPFACEYEYRFRPRYYPR